MFGILATHSDGLLSPTTYTTSVCARSSASGGCSEAISEDIAGCLCWGQNWEHWDEKSQGSAVPGENQPCRRPQPPPRTGPHLPLPVKGARISLHGTGENQLICV